MDLMSTAQLLGNFGEFVGAIAVVGTLVYLAVQVKQSKVAMDANTRALEETRKQARVDALRDIAFNWNNIIHDTLGSHESAAIFVRGSRDLSDLDEIEQQIYISQLVPFLNQSHVILQMAQEGILGEEIVGEDISESLDGMIGDLLRNSPGARTCWQGMEFNWPHREHVNALLEREAGGNRWTLGAPMVEPKE